MSETQIREIERLENEFAWNVISENEFKKRVRKVFEMVADCLSNTLGPYGSTTILEKFGDVHITKDGWQLLKKISFQDPTNANILQLLINISAQVVIKVGDGSTSSIIAADELLKAIENDSELRNVRPKELLDSLSTVVNKICEVIEKNATQIDKSENATYEDIKNIATISTNGDIEIPAMIQEIYLKTHNPAIEFVKSKDNKTKVEIINGYKMPFMTYLDRLFINNDEGTCILKNPMILMFDHKIDRDYYDTIIAQYKNKALQENRKLVVIAPYYDQFLLDRLSRDLQLQHRQLGETLEVYVRTSLMNDHMSNLYVDLSSLLGTVIITQNVVEEILDTKNPISTQEMFDMNLDGTVEKIVIGEKATLFTGFINKDENRYNLLMNDAISKYNKQVETDKELSLVNDTSFKLKQRISKLKCVMGSISVGGSSELEKTANYDLVEDAVKACESAYIHGYNIGQNMAIQKAIYDIINENNNSTSQLSLIEDSLIKVIGNAFTNVLRRVIINKDPNVTYEEVSKIINNGVFNNKCLNLITDEPTSDIINSCRTDVEILRATTSIVGLLISSNQYISIAIQ
ncbi:TCP-1/cpn60 chaperonin family protein [Romboutsia ilealis]|uniref:TCP-1/cpn60 chaperonin family protein n=1 Tax=Romboutsia ilealis TaxID=1115758 RepID=UPI00272DB3AD|nr:TCP-1/cpn60 chaperonin family protein [Romboutsia ilealis]